MSAKINNSIERQMVSAASAGKLSIMKPATQGGSTGQEATEKAAKYVLSLLGSRLFLTRSPLESELTGSVCPSSSAPPFDP